MKLITLPLAFSIACAVAATPSFASSNAPKAPDASHKLDLQQVRNATVKITYGGTTFLIDPMLAKKAPTRVLKILIEATFAIPG